MLVTMPVERWCGSRSLMFGVGGSPDCRVGWAPVPLVGWVFLSGTVSGGGSGERGADAVPAGGDGLGPGPVGVDPQPGLPGSAADPGGDVQHPVAEGLDLAAGQRGA